MIRVDKMRKVSMVVDLSTKVVLLHKNKGCGGASTPFDIYSSKHVAADQQNPHRQETWLLASRRNRQTAICLSHPETIIYSGQNVSAQCSDPFCCSWGWECGWVSIIVLFFWQVTPWFLQIMRHMYYVYYYLYIEGERQQSAVGFNTRIHDGCLTIFVH